MPGLAPIRRTLDAGQSVPVGVRGSLIFLRRVLTGPPADLYSGGTGVNALLPIRVTAEVAETGERYEVDMAASEKLSTAAEYYRLELTNPNASAVWAELYCGVGDFYRPVPDIINVSYATASQSLDDADDETNIDTGNAGAVNIVAQAAETLRVMITALASNSDAIRVGNANVDSDNGIPLQPGESIALYTQADIYVCAETTDNQGAAVLIEAT